MNNHKETLRKRLYLDFGLAAEDASSASDVGSEDEITRLATFIHEALEKTPSRTSNPEAEVAAIRQRAAAEKTTPGRVIRPSFNRSRRRILSGLAAAALVAIAVGVVLLMPRSPKLQSFRLAAWKGSPQLRSGATLQPLSSSNLLSGPFQAVTDKKEGLLVAFGSNRIQLAGETTLACNAFQVKDNQTSARLSLTRGLAVFNLEANQFREFHVSFPRGEAVVTGTLFSVRVTPKRTYVAVLKGSVRVQHASSGKTSTVLQNKGIILEKDKSIPVTKLSTSRKMARLLHHMKTLGKFKEYVPPRKKQAPNRHNKPVRFQEKVYLKNGTVITGRIIQQTEEMVRIRSSLGVVTIPWKNVARVAYIKN